MYIYIYIYIFKGWIVLTTTKFWKPIGSWKLIRHPRWDFLAPVNSTGRGVPQPPSNGRLQLLCQCFSQAMLGSIQQLSNRLVRPAQADTLAALADMTNTYRYAYIWIWILHNIINMQYVNGLSVYSFSSAAAEDSCNRFQRHHLRRGRQWS